MITRKIQFQKGSSVYDSWTTETWFSFILNN